MNDEKKRVLRVAVAADHAGFALKEQIKETVTELGHEVVDLGTDDAVKSVDYPDFGFAIAQALVDGKADYGVAVCGTGIGISIAANRETSVRAALCHDATTARLSRQHNDANVLALGARVIGTEIAVDCVKAFLTTEFEGGRHAARVAKLSHD